MTKNRELTFGEKAVDLKVDGSELIMVHTIKEEFAKAIDRLNDLRESFAATEVKSMLNLAITEAKTAQRLAVKAVTLRG